MPPALRSHGRKVPAVKLSAEELERLAAQFDASRERCMPAQPGSREQPIGYSELLAERRRLVGDRS